MKMLTCGECMHIFPLNNPSAHRESDVCQLKELIDSIKIDIFRFSFGFI